MSDLVSDRNQRLPRTKQNPRNESATLSKRSIVMARRMHLFCNIFRTAGNVLPERAAISPTHMQFPQNSRVACFASVPASAASHVLLRFLFHVAWVDGKGEPHSAILFHTYLLSISGIPKHPNQTSGSGAKNSQPFAIATNSGTLTVGHNQNQVQSGAVDQWKSIFSPRRTHEKHFCI